MCPRTGGACIQVLSLTVDGRLFRGVRMFLGFLTSAGGCVHRRYVRRGFRCRWRGNGALGHLGGIRRGSRSRQAGRLFAEWRGGSADPAGAE